MRQQRERHPAPKSPADMRPRAMQHHETHALRGDGD